MLKQAQSQNSVTGGGVDRKNIWGAQINFSLKFESEDQKNRSLSQIKPGGYGPFTIFRGKKSRSGDTFIAWGGARESRFLAISFGVETKKKKKVFSVKP